MKELEQSIVNKISVEMDYHTSHEAQHKRRIVDPYGIIYWNNNWYVIAYCHLRNEIRSFRARRITRLTQTGDPFNRPPYFSAGEFFMKSLFPEAGDQNGLVPLVLGGKTSALDNLCQHWFLAHHLKERTLENSIFILEEDLMSKVVGMLENTTFVWGVFVADSSKPFPNFFPVGLYTTRELAINQLEIMPRDNNYQSLKMPINKDFSYYHKKHGKLVGMDVIHHEHFYFKDESSNNH